MDCADTESLFANRVFEPEQRFGGSRWKFKHGYTIYSEVRAGKGQTDMTENALRIIEVIVPGIVIVVIEIVGLLVWWRGRKRAN